MKMGLSDFLTQHNPNIESVDWVSCGGIELTLDPGWRRWQESQTSFWCQPICSRGNRPQDCWQQIIGKYKILVYIESIPILYYNFNPGFIFFKQVHAKHEEKSDTKSVYREYNREFLLPAGVNPELIRSSLSKDGVLTVEAPLPQPALTGPPQGAIKQ